MSQRDARRQREEEAREQAHELEPAEGLELALSLPTLNALARNALAAVGDSPLAPKVPIKFVAGGKSLAHDGCDYIEGTNLFLAVRGFPSVAQPLIVALAGMSGGDPDAWFKATDEQIAARLNCSTKTVQEMRKVVKLWSLDTGYAVIQIKEYDFDHSLGAQPPTEYRVPVVGGAERLVKWARTNAFWQRHPQTAITNAAHAELKEYVERESESLPVETVVRARKARKGKEEKKRDPAAVQFTNQKKKVLYLARKLVDAGLALGYDMNEVWGRMKADIDAYIEKQSS